MPITADHIRATLTAYLDDHPQDGVALAGIVDALESGTDITSRKEMRGHVTAGAVLLDGEGDVLLVRHVALGTWLTPGGHVEHEDATLVDAARRELVEETGIRPEDVVPVADAPVHIDVHPIPANPAKGEGAHRHFDFRFLFRAIGHLAVTVQEEEVSGAAWRDAASLGDPVLRARVAGVDTPLRTGFARDRSAAVTARRAR